MPIGPSVLRPEYHTCVAEWGALVRANAEQTERLRETEEANDFYAPVASTFAADPSRRDDPTLNALLSLAAPEETWIDVGAGGGRYALGLARAVSQVIAVEPSEGMRAVLAETQSQHGIRNVEVIAERWPLAQPLTGDVAVVTHVGYDVAEIGPFLEALEASARRLCVAVLFDRPPGSAVGELWELVHGEPRAQLPALREFVTLLLARGRVPEVQVVGRREWSPTSREDAVKFCRRWLWLREGSAKDRRMLERLEGFLAPSDDGGCALRLSADRIAMVTWTPEGRERG